ncbi:ME1 [Symbiodinium sp. CCMP2592]|nr:ME1 [Symbiodinium sp. CCMP2592]
MRPGRAEPFTPPARSKVSQAPPPSARVQPAKPPAAAQAKLQPTPTAAPKVQPKAPPASAAVKTSGPGPETASESKPHGQLGSEMPSQRASLQWERRWASWRKKAVEVGACIWADIRVEGEASVSKLKREVTTKLTEALGAEAVVSILAEDFDSTRRLFVCLLAKAEECTELRSTWRSLKLLDGVTVSWRDTLDTASHNHVPYLRESWNPKKLPVDSVSLTLPAHWAFEKGKLPDKPPVACAAGSHWHDFAQVFGEVMEASFAWYGEATETVQLVVRYVKGGPKSAYLKLTGRCLHNPLSGKPGKRDLFLVRAVYGTYGNLLKRVTEQAGKKSKFWLDGITSELPPRPESASAGPIFELFPLQSFSAAAAKKRLLIAPWGASHFVLGSSMQCDLHIFHDGISKEHAELSLMVPWKQHAAAHLSVFVTDKSKNGTYVNGQRIAKDAVLQLREGDILRLADVPTYATGPKVRLRSAPVSFHRGCKGCTATRELAFGCHGVRGACVSLVHQGHQEESQKGSKRQRGTLGRGASTASTRGTLAAVGKLRASPLCLYINVLCCSIEQPVMTLRGRCALVSSSSCVW